MIVDWIKKTISNEEDDETEECDHEWDVYVEGTSWIKNDYNANKNTVEISFCERGRLSCDGCDGERPFGKYTWYGDYEPKVFVYEVPVSNTTEMTVSRFMDQI